VCAERAAVTRAIAEGKGGFVTIAIATDGLAAIAPCGACRQVLAEFSPDLRVVSEGLSARRTWSLRDLLPDPFEAPPGWPGRKDEEGT